MIFNTSNIGSQSNKICIVTGANSGIGFEVAKALSGKGAEVIMACRNKQKAENAIQSIITCHPNAKLAFIELDLSDFSSVHTFASEFNKKYKNLDILINNASQLGGEFELNKEGIELLFATNHLGHFLLTGLLMEKIKNSQSARIVSLGSLMHKKGKLSIDDMNIEAKYRSTDAYSRSKLASMMFAYELERRLEANHLLVKSIAAHPGWSVSANNNISLMSIIGKLIAQSYADGSLPILYAATAEHATGGGYYGPDGMGQLKGSPVELSSSNFSYQLEPAKRLWKVSEELTGFKFTV